MLQLKFRKPAKGTGHFGVAVAPHHVKGPHRAKGAAKCWKGAGGAMCGQCKQHYPGRSMTDCFGCGTTLCENCLLKCELCEAEKRAANAELEAEMCSEPEAENECKEPLKHQQPSWEALEELEEALACNVNLSRQLEERNAQLREANAGISTRDAELKRLKQFVGLLQSGCRNLSAASLDMLDEYGAGLLVVSGFQGCEWFSV